MANKITLNGENLFILRSTKTKPDGSKTVSYYESRTMWNSNPLRSTIFTDYDAAHHHQHEVWVKRPPKGWTDGSTEVLDVVPLLGEVKLSPYGIPIDPKPKEPT